MEHSCLRLLATTLLPGIVVFVILFTVRTPVIHTQSYWGGHHPHPQKNGDIGPARVSKRSASSTKLREEESSHLIGLRNPEDPGACLKDSACRGYLTGQARESYIQCMARVRKYSHSKKAKDNGCRFLDGRKRGIVALASFPGSGNTWVRTLLEKATGICSGSYTCDMSLRYAGFTGEGIQSPNVVVVKTHQVAPHWGDGKSSFKVSSAIVIVRNPLDALVSDWNRYVANGFQVKTVHLGTHTQKAGKEYFRNNTRWNGFVQRRSYTWMQIIDNWIIDTISLKSQKHKVLVVMYEDLQENEEIEMERMLKFLRLGPYTNDTLTSDDTPHTRPSQNFTATFHRKHSDNEEPFDPFTLQQRAHVMNIIAQTQKKLQKHNMTPILDVSRYLTRTS